MVFPPTAEAVAHSVGLDPSCCLTALKALIDQRKLIKSQLTGYLGFSIQFNQQIYDAIDKYIAVNKNSIRIADILNEINPDPFYVPKKYNTDHHMVRFFRSRFIEAEVFIQLSSYDDLLNEAFCDGLILNIVPANKISSDQLLGDHRKSQSGTRKTGLFRKAPKLDGAGFRSLALIDRVGDPVLRNIRLIGRVEKEYGAVLVGIIHPLLQGLF